MKVACRIVKRLGLCVVTGINITDCGLKGQPCDHAKTVAKELDQPAPEGESDRQLLEQARDALNSICKLDASFDRYAVGDAHEIALPALAALNKRLGEGEHDKVW